VCALGVVLIDPPGGEATGDLCGDVETGISTRDRVLDEHHDGDCWIEVTSGDGSADEDDGGEGKTDDEWVSRGEDHEKKNEGSEEFYTVFSEIVHFLENKRKNR
jgi:hypothetical protein